MKYIFIHGLGQSASSWDETFGAIGKPMDLLAPELSEMVQNKEVTYTRENVGYEVNIEAPKKLSEVIKTFYFKQ